MNQAMFESQPGASSRAGTETVSVVYAAAKALGELCRSQGTEAKCDMAVWSRRLVPCAAAKIVGYITLYRLGISFVVLINV